MTKKPTLSLERTRGHWNELAFLRNFFRANQRFVSYQPRPKAWVYFGIFTQANGLPQLSSLAGSDLPDATTDKVENLDAGADDYLTKPFAFAELKVRVR